MNTLASCTLLSSSLYQGFAHPPPTPPGHTYQPITEQRGGAILENEYYKRCTLATFSIHQTLSGGLLLSGLPNFITSLLCSLESLAFYKLFTTSYFIWPFHYASSSTEQFGEHKGRSLAKQCIHKAANIAQHSRNSRLTSN